MVGGPTGLQFISKMYAKTFIFSFVALAVVATCLASPVADPEPCGGCGCGDCCTVHRCHTVPYSSCIPIHTTHRLIPSSNCGCGCGGGYGGWGNGGWGGWGGWGNGGCGCGCGCGCGGWGGW